MDLLILAAAADPPIIDLDSTALVQLVIFIVTALLLSRFLFRPYLALRAQRGAGTEGAREEARRMEEAASARLADYEAGVARAKAKANAERVQLQSEAVGRDREITEAARLSSQNALEEAGTRLGIEAETARTQLAPRVREIARAIAGRILGREVA